MEKLIYLDNAATSWPKPDEVYDYMVEFYKLCGVNPGRSGFDMAIEAGDILENVRAKLMKFFGGDEDLPERLCFGYNATDALNLIIQGLLKSGDHVVTTNLEHNSVIRPVNHLVRDQGVEVIEETPEATADFERVAALALEKVKGSVFPAAAWDQLQQALKEVRSQ